MPTLLYITTHFFTIVITQPNFCCIEPWGHFYVAGQELAAIYKYFSWSDSSIDLFELQ